MSDDRCGAVHPTLGIRCDRIKKDCYIDHTATLKSGLGIFWPNPAGTTPMHEYFRLLISWKTGEGAETDTRGYTIHERKKRP